MNKVKSIYHKIVIPNSIFGVIQIKNIFIPILRFKFMAVFLGSMRLEIVGLFTSKINLDSNSFE